MKNNNRKEIERNSMIVKVLSDNNIELTGSAYIEEISNKNTSKGVRQNLLLTDIQFSVNNEEYEIDHCWLQQCDYPPKFKYNVIEGELYYFSFTFYPYRDAINRNMHGMDISSIELY